MMTRGNDVSRVFLTSRLTSEIFLVSLLWCLYVSLSVTALMMDDGSYGHMVVDPASD